MRIIDLYGLSEEERKKALEEQQSLYNERMQQSDEIRRQANQQFNNLISKQGEYDTTRHTTTIGNLRNAYKNSSNYNKLNDSLNRIYLNSENSIWNKMQNIMTFNKTNNQRNNNIDIKNNGIDNWTTANNMAKQNNDKVNMIATTQTAKSLYEEKQKEAIKNTVEYNLIKSKNPNMSEEELIEKTKLETENKNKQFNQAFSNMSKEDRRKEIFKTQNMLSNKEGLYETEEKKNENRKIINNLLQKSEAIEAEKQAEKVNKTLNEGNFLERATTATGELAGSMGKSAIDMTLSPIVAVGSLAEGVLPTKNFKGTKFDDIVDYKKIKDRAETVKNANIENEVLKTGKGVSSTIGGMIPSIVANIVVPGSNIGMIAQASGVAGEDYIENLNEDKSNKLQSAFSGTLKGLGSYATEKITGGNILGKGSLDDWATRTIANKTSSKIAQKIASKVYEVGGENFEELLENQIDHLVDSTVNNKGVSFKDWLDEQSETVKQTTLTQLFLNLMGVGGSTYNEVQEYSQNAEMKQWINEAQKIIDKENLNIDNYKINNNNINEVRKTLNELPIKNTAETKQESTQNEQILPTQQINQEQNNTAQNGNMEQIKIDTENFSKQVDAVKKGTFPQKDMLTIGKTPQVLKDIGLPDLPITMTQKHLDTIMNEKGKYKGANYHNLGEDIVKQLPEAINNPLDIVKSNTKDDSIVLTTYLADKQDKPVIASIKIDGKGRVNDIIIDSNVMTSAYGRNNYDKFMQDNIENGNLLYDIDRGVIKKVTEARLQLPRVGNSTTIDGSSITNSILPTKENVNSDTITNNYAQSNENNTKNEINLPISNKVMQERNNTDTLKVKFENDNKVKESEEISNEETAKILTEPISAKNEKRKLTAFLKANLIDKGMVFEELSRKTGNRELQSKYDYTLTAEARGQNAIGNARYDYQPTIDEKGKIRKGDSEPKQISKSLTDIIDEVGENPEEFYNYMYHQLNIDRMTLEDRFGGDTGTNYERKNAIKNKPVFGKGVTAELSQKYVQELEQKHPEFKEYAQDVYDFLDANKQELVRNGVISQETSDLFKEMYPHYVPIARVTNKGSAINVPLDTGRTGINNPIKKAKGGNRDIQPLFQTMADRTLQTYRASAKNSFGVELKNTLEYSNQLNQNIEITDIDNILESMTDETKNNELLQKGENGNNPTFTVFENGNKVTYEISNDMYDALKPKNEILKRIDESRASKVLTKINNFRRGLLTEYNPIFSITNAIKDAQDVLLNSQHSAKTYSKFPESTAQILSKGYWYKEYIQNGGEQNSYFRDGDFEVKKTNLPSKIKNTITLPLRAISNVNNIIEMTPRLAEYISSREKGASIETAMLDASRVTTNFKAGGDVVKTLNRNGATFLNASVQGMQQQIRNIQEANAKGLKGYATLATKYAIAGLPALFLNNVIWGDDDDYEDLQDYVKDNYYIVGKTEEGTFIRIPKGRAVATIQKIVSNASDFINETANGNSINIEKLGSAFWNDLKEDLDFAKDNLAPNNISENWIGAPITQALNNKTWYGEDLVPTRLQDKPKEEQYDESTDWLSKWIGEQLKVSPMKVNYLLDQYTGGVGDVILPMMTPQAENNVIEDKFTTNPTMKSKFPGEFFEKIDELNVANNSEKASDLDKVKYKYATEIQGEISDLYKEKRKIQNSSKEDKIKKIELEQVQKKINDLTEKGLKSIDKVKVDGDTSSINGINYYKLDGKWEKVSDDDNEKIKNISLNTYADFKNKVKKETDAKKGTGELDENQQLKDKDKIALLKGSKYSDKEKKEIYSKFINTKDTTYSNLNKITNVNIDAYLEYKLQDIEGDEDTTSKVKGKTVKGSKEENFYNYLKNSNLSTIERLYIYGTSYKLDNQGRRIIQEAIERTAVSQEEKKNFYKKLSANVEEYKDGSYHWK